MQVFDVYLKSDMIGKKVFYQNGQKVLRQCRSFKGELRHKSDIQLYIFSA